MQSTLRPQKTRPFWAVVGAGIARVDFRLMFGYRLIFAAICS